MRTTRKFPICGVLIALVMGATNIRAAKPPVEEQPPLTNVGQKFQAQYAGELEQLRAELAGKLPQSDQAKVLDEFLSTDSLDAQFVKYVVLLQATPQGLAEFAQQGRGQGVPG